MKVNFVENVWRTLYSCMGTRTRARTQASNQKHVTVLCYWIVVDHFSSRGEPSVLSACCRHPQSLVRHTERFNITQHSNTTAQQFSSTSVRYGSTAVQFQQLSSSTVDSTQYIEYLPRLRWLMPEQSSNASSTTPSSPRDVTVILDSLTHITSRCDSIKHSTTSKHFIHYIIAQLNSPTTYW